ncbi:hypothetical protein BLX87_01590 [Bacillus sp. VT-16-64]|nr:hypothetical protein BLX87_01590 [Bacillus sp. VT-16-64]
MRNFQTSNSVERMEAGFRRLPPSRTKEATPFIVFPAITTDRQVRADHFSRGSQIFVLDTIHT